MFVVNEERYTISGSLRTVSMLESVFPSCYGRYDNASKANGSVADNSGLKSCCFVVSEVDRMGLEKTYLVSVVAVVSESTPTDIYLIGLRSYSLLGYRLPYEIATYHMSLVAHDVRNGHSSILVIFCGRSKCNRV